MTAKGYANDEKVLKSGDTMTGTLILEGAPPLTIPSGAAATYVWTSDLSGNGSWQPAPGATSGASAPIAGSAGDAVQRLAIPSYFYPTYYNPTGYWQQMQAAAPYAAICVINPASGPGVASNSDYVTQTIRAQASGMRVLGYVHTSYTGATQASIEAQIDSYYSWYAVDGIFIDEVTTAAGSQSYYQGLYAYIKGKTGARIVVINPGTIPDVSYMTACDIVCNCETDLGTYRVRAAASWEASYPSSRFWHIIYAVLTQAQRDEVLTLSRSYRAGYVHITNDTDPNPYDTLPADPYWSGLVSQIGLPLPVASQAPIVEDGFDATTGFINTAWTIAGSVTIVSHALVITGHNSYADTATSAVSFSFAGHAASVQASSLPAAASGEGWMRVAEDATDYIAIGKSGANLVLRSTVAGVNSDVPVTYSATAHAYWQLTLSATGTATWQTSPDNATWTTQRTLSSGLPVLTAAKLVLLAGHYNSGDPDQTATFDQVLVL